MSEKCRACCAEGRAMFTIVASRTTISWASATTARISQRRGSAPATGGTGIGPRAGPGVAAIVVPARRLLVRNSLGMACLLKERMFILNDAAVMLLCQERTFLLLEL